MVEKQTDIVRDVTGRNDLRSVYDRADGGWKLVGELPDGSQGSVYGLGKGCNTTDFYNRLYGLCQGFIATMTLSLTHKNPNRLHGNL